MKSTAARCRKSFEKVTIERGTRYFRDRAVTLLRTDDDSITAQVQGSAPNAYRVEIDWARAQAGHISAFCDCPHFADGNLCKHVWATLLQVDADQLSGGVAQRADLLLEELDEYDFDEEDDLSQDGFDDSADRTLDLSTANGKSTKQPAWRRQLDAVSAPSDGQRENPFRAAAESRRHRVVWYVIDVGTSLKEDRLIIDFHLAETKKSGKFGKIKSLSVKHETLSTLTDDRDRQLLGLLISDSVGSGSRHYPYRPSDWESYSYCTPTASTYDLVLPRMAATGRLVWLLDASLPIEGTDSVEWDDGPAWQFGLNVAADDERKQWTLRGTLQRAGDTVPLDDAVLVLGDGLVVFRDSVARFSGNEAARWLKALRRNPSIDVPYDDRDTFLPWLWQTPNLPDIDWPENLQVEQQTLAPQGRLVLKSERRSHQVKHLFGEVAFVYGETIVALHDDRLGWYDAKHERAIRRDRDAERMLLEQLSKVGARPRRTNSYFDSDVQFHRKHFVRIVRELTSAGWLIESHGQRIRQPGAFNLSVSTNVDWFELDGQVDFEGVTASLPKLLAALRSGDTFIRLDDGSQGMLPEDWLDKYGALARLAKSEGESLRFTSSQALLLDALLAEQDDVQLDSGFLTFRDKLSEFDGINPVQDPRGFRGELREYQREGLGWLHFLRDFRFGGCLADDMGLGKTVQVLALLQTRRLAKQKRHKPSLVIVPKSLIFNWIEEATRFTPNLRVRDFTGLDRGKQLERLDECDILLTTYGTLRRDIVRLKDIDFDYAILDESQAIKNRNSQAAKACRLLKANQRLAMTGTPVENHLGELWSLFEFLNPGMLGQTGAFEALAKTRQDGDDGQVALLARAIRPFILRRTKAEVLSELPEKTEQTLYCELPPEERKEYDELRDYYRVQLATKVEEFGLNKSKIHVLEALLRLRQAACHPGLLDKSKQMEPSAKLEALLEHLDEVQAERHKALVFSQFTSLLAIVRKHLDEREVTYEYLDGKTRKRGEKVKRFQEDPDCPLFLISLKAGGHGLNLTAADYVFILDPWWNPAVEAQAIDRAHRIGQTRHVFAYRLIARNTVEEKIVELQKSKRDLADAIITGNDSLIRRLTADDLQLLLS
ncbi:MAG: helicase SNF2 [Planctomycetaceae bacterium]|nr:helicase SNF2 [Planctomycetaceae bacterium]